METKQINRTFNCWVCKKDKSQEESASMDAFNSSRETCGECYKKERAIGYKKHLKHLLMLRNRTHLTKEEVERWDKRIKRFKEEGR